MKKIIILAIIAILAVSTAFASGLSVGLYQNFYHTGALVDYEISHFGVEAGAGIPLLSGISNYIDYYLVDHTGEENPPKKPDIVSSFLLPDANINLYWKAVDASRFQLRLGLNLEAASVIVGRDDFSVLGLLGISLGLQYRFSDRFSMGIMSSVPAAIPVSLISEDAAAYTAFFISGNNTASRENSWTDVFATGFMAYFDTWAKLSFKWSL